MESGARGMPALRVIHPGEVFEARRHLGMIKAEDLFYNVQRLLIERLYLGVYPLFVIPFREFIESCRHGYVEIGFPDSRYRQNRQS